MKILRIERLMLRAMVEVNLIASVMDWKGFLDLMWLLDFNNWDHIPKTLCVRQYGPVLKNWNGHVVSRTSYLEMNGQRRNGRDKKTGRRNME